VLKTNTPSPRFKARRVGGVSEVLAQLAACGASRFDSFDVCRM